MATSSRLRTPICDMLSIDLPIIQAPIGRVSGPELVAAVSNAGGLGMLGVSYLDAEDLRVSIRQTRSLTDRPFGVNLLLEWNQRERLEVVLDEGVRLISYFWAELAPESAYVSDAHAAGALVMHTVGSAAEARRAVNAGIDIVVAQGTDAGGHVWGSVGTLSLIPAVVDAVSPVPVVAAGGIGDGRGLAAVLALGAQAAWIGTRFVVADEARSDPGYRDRVVQASETDAVWSTGVFDEGFPDAPVRTLDNSTLRSWREAGSPRQGPRPGEGDVIAHRSNGTPVARYDFAPPVEGMTGDLEAMANYAGQSAGVVTRRQGATDIVREMAGQAERALDAASS